MPAAKSHQFAVPTGLRQEGDLIAYYDPQFETTTGRTHPYDGGVKPGVQYYNFRERPDLIEQVLEDFLPWARYPAVQTFYEFLRWVNGPESVLESNDSRLTGVRPNGFVRDLPYKLECVSGVMIFLRHLPFNRSPDHVDWLGNQMLVQLRAEDATFRAGRIALTKMPVDFLDLPEDEPDRLGTEILVTSFAAGNTAEETMGNLNRCHLALAAAMRRVSDGIRGVLECG